MTTSETVTTEFIRTKRVLNHWTTKTAARAELNAAARLPLFRFGRIIKSEQGDRESVQVIYRMDAIFEIESRVGVDYNFNVADEWMYTQKRKRLYGFATMTPEKQREISRMGGFAAARTGKSHRWNSEEARAAGHKGGKNRRRKSDPPPHDAATRTGMYDHD